MSEEKTAAKSAIKTAAAATADTQKYAKIRALKTPVNVPGGKIAKGAVVENCPLAHAEALEKKGEAEILEYK